MLDSRLTIRLNPALILKLQVEAKQRHMTLSALVREVLEENLAGRALRVRKAARRWPGLS